MGCGACVFEEREKMIEPGIPVNPRLLVDSLNMPMSRDVYKGYGPCYIYDHRFDLSKWTRREA